MVRVAVLDDYQNVARQVTDWSVLPSDVEIQIFQGHLKDEDAVAERLKDFGDCHGDARAHAFSAQSVRETAKNCNS